MRVAFKTIGCRLNQAETAALTTMLENAGCTIVPFGDSCDICIIHSCAVTADAERKNIRYARVASRLPCHPQVVVIGCGVDAQNKTLIENTDNWILLPNAEKFTLLEVLGLTKTVTPAKPDSRTFPHFSTVRALLRVQSGCDFKCAYCIVPFLRGKPYSRPAAVLINEAKSLADAGYREIVLTGTNLGRYSDGNTDLVKLIQQLESIPAIQRIRLSSIELTTIERELIDYMASSTKLCRYLHVPLQTADDKLLCAMGRHYNSSQYRKFMEYAFNKIEDLGFGTDIIVGLPGETQQAFENTRKFITDLPFSNLHIFPYSKRKGTPASTMPGHISPCEKKARVAIMIALRAQKKETFVRKFTGKQVSVLIERVDNNGKGYGWSSQYIQCEIIPSRHRLSVNDIIQFTPATCNKDRLCGQY